MENLLYIEDEAQQREVIVRLYHMTKKVFHGEVGFLTADSWEAGMKTVTGGHVSVILLDLVLPPWKHEETLAEVNNHWKELPPIIAFTGMDLPRTEKEESLRERAIQAGCDDFLLKEDFNHRPEDLMARAWNAFLRRKRDDARR